MNNPAASSSPILLAQEDPQRLQRILVAVLRRTAPPLLGPDEVTGVVAPASEPNAQLKS